MPGDHRTLGIDFDTKILFGNHEPPTLRYAQQRGVNSNAIPTVHRFCEIVTKGWHDTNIQGRLATLEHKVNFTLEDHTTLELIDQDLTEILVKADKQCQKFKGTPWSPKLHYTYLEHRYWNLQASHLKTGRNYDHILAKLRIQLGITNNDPNHRQTIRTNLRCIQQQFCTICKEAADHRKKFLEELILAAKTTKNKQ